MVKSHDELLDEIVGIESRMFMAIEPVTPSACQQQPDTFKTMRAAGFSALSEETLRSYLNDLEEAMDEGRNLVELKYARIDNLIPPLSENPVIDRIVEAEGRWLRELEAKYPNTFVGRSEFAIDTYLKSELEMYSDHTLDLYYRDIERAQKEGHNLVADKYAYLFREIGYDSIEAMEEERKRRQG